MDRETLWVKDFWRVALSAVQNGVMETLVDGSENDVMVDELTPLHYHHCVTNV